MKGRRLHFIAIGGAGMSGLALVCHRLGAIVSGSDRSESVYVDRLRRAGLEPRIGHDADAVPADGEVIVSTAIAEDNPELARARERGQAVLHRAELLAELCEGRRLLAVSGTHGKTTTTAMIAYALCGAGVDPTFLIGGDLLGAGDRGEPANAGLGEGDWIVVEADESDNSFQRLRPEVAVVTNIELDHHSHWRSLAELRRAFAEFAAPARVLVAGEQVGIDRDWAELSGQRRLSFAIEDAARPAALSSPAEHWLAGEISSSPAGTGFTLSGPEGVELAVSLRAHGRHNVLNAIAALSAISVIETGAPHGEGEGETLLGESARALRGFPGVSRRLEFKGERNGARIYDDYAHHPTEVAASLQAARELVPRRLIAVFQPHLFSRTKALAREFGAALAGADEIVVTDIYGAREQAVGELAGVSGLQVAEAAAERAGGRPVWWLPDATRVPEALSGRLGDGDVLITIGAGDIDRLAGALVESGS